MHLTVRSLGAVHRRLQQMADENDGCRIHRFDHSPPPPTESPNERTRQLRISGSWSLSSIGLQQNIEIGGLVLIELHRSRTAECSREDIPPFQGSSLLMTQEIVGPEWRRLRREFNAGRQKPNGSLLWPMQQSGVGHLHRSRMVSVTSLFHRPIFRYRVNHNKRGNKCSAEQDHRCWSRS